uniref:Uncharacterized protein n=1 Tax=Anguilla anguilla TaxID=7936 RepID=A0A0E9V4E4_ANGAN
MGEKDRKDSHSYSSYSVIYMFY